MADADMERARGVSDRGIHRRKTKTVKPDPTSLRQWGPYLTSRGWYYPNWDEHGDLTVPFFGGKPKPFPKDASSPLPPILSPLPSELGKGVTDVTSTGRMPYDIDKRQGDRTHRTPKRRTVRKGPTESTPTEGQQISTGKPQANNVRRTLQKKLAVGINKLPAEPREMGKYHPEVLLGKAWRAIFDPNTEIQAKEEGERVRQPIPSPKTVLGEAWLEVSKRAPREKHRRLPEWAPEPEVDPRTLERRRSVSYVAERIRRERAITGESRGTAVPHKSTTRDVIRRTARKVLKDAGYYEALSWGAENILPDPNPDKPTHPGVGGGSTGGGPERG